MFFFYGISFYCSLMAFHSLLISLGSVLFICTSFIATASERMRNGCGGRSYWSSRGLRQDLKVKSTLYCNKKKQPLPININVILHLYSEFRSYFIQVSLDSFVHLFAIIKLLFTDQLTELPKSLSPELPYN